MNNSANRIACFSILIIAFWSLIQQSQAQTNAEAWTQIGVSNGNAGKFTISITNFTRAIELDTNFLPAYFCRGQTEFYFKDYHSAISDYGVVINAKPPVDDVYILGKAFNQRGRSKFALKDWSGAIADFDESIKLEPKIGETYFNRGLAKARLEKLTEAIEDYTKAIEMHTDTNMDDIFFCRGNAEMDTAKYNEAIIDYSKISKSYLYYKTACTNLTAAKNALKDSNK